MDDLKIVLQGILDPTSTKKEIEDTIGILEKTLEPLKLKIDIDPKTLEAIKKIAKLIPKDMPKIDIGRKDIEKQLKQMEADSAKYMVAFRKNVEQNIETAKNKVRKDFGKNSIIGTVVNKDGAGEIKNFVVDVKDAYGQLRKVNFELAEVEGKKSPQWVSTWIRDLNISEAELKKLNQLQEKLITNLNVGLQKGTVDKSAYDKMLKNITKADNMDKLKQYENENKILQTQFDVQKKTTAEIDKQTRLLGKRMTDLNKEGKLSPNKMGAMNADFGSAQQTGTLKSLQDFAKKYENELQILSPTQKKFNSTVEALQQELIGLFRTGKYSNDELRAIGTQLYNVANSSNGTIKKLEGVKTALANFKFDKSIIAEQDKLRESLTKLFDQGTVNQKFFQSFNKSINSAGNIEEINKLQRALKNVQENIKTGSANASLKEKLTLNSQQLLQTHKGNVNTADVNALLALLKQINVESPKANQELKMLESEFNKLKSEAVGMKASMMFAETIQGQKQKAQNMLIQLARTGQYTQEQLRKIGTTIYSTESMHVLMEQMDKLAKMNLNVSFQNQKKGVQKALNDMAKSGKYAKDEIDKLGVGLNSSRTIADIDKIKATMDNMKLSNKIDSEKQKLVQQLEQISRTTDLSAKKMANFNNAINGAKNIEQLNKIENAMNKFKSESSNAFNLEKFQNNMQVNLTNLMRTYSKYATNDGGKKDIGSVMKDIMALTPQTQNLQREVEKLAMRFRTVSANIRQASDASRQAEMGFGKLFTTALKRFPVWMMATTFYYAPLHALKDMVSRLIEIDTQMTEIRRVMNLPDFKFEQLLQQAVQTSDELATKLTDVLKIMGEFGRMGYSSGELGDISTTAQVLQNISDLDPSQSVDTLVSAMTNFNITAKDSIKIADKLNEVKFSSFPLQ